MPSCNTSLILLSWMSWMSYSSTSEEYGEENRGILDPYVRIIAGNYLRDIRRTVM